MAWLLGMVVAPAACSSPQLTFVDDTDAGAPDGALEDGDVSDAAASDGASAADGALVADGSDGGLPPASDAIAPVDAAGIDAGGCLTATMPAGTHCCPSGAPCFGTACSHCADCGGCATGLVCCAVFKGAKYDKAACDAPATVNATTCP